jgi:hypothetical protein
MINGEKPPDIGRFMAPLAEAFKTETGTEARHPFLTALGGQTGITMLTKGKTEMKNEIQQNARFLD